MEDDTLSDSEKEFDDNEAGIVIDHLMKYWIVYFPFFEKNI